MKDNNRIQCTECPVLLKPKFAANHYDAHAQEKAKAKKQESDMFGIIRSVNPDAE